LIVAAHEMGVASGALANPIRRAHTPPQRPPLTARLATPNAAVEPAAHATRRRAQSAREWTASMLMLVQDAGPDDPPVNVVEHVVRLT
jgi:hypothetical protein